MSVSQSKPNFSMPLIGVDSELVACMLSKTQEIGQSSPKPEMAPGENRRQSARYEIAIPAVCFPLLASLEVDTSLRIDGVITDVSRYGLGISIASNSIVTGDRMVIAADFEMKGFRFIDGQVIRVTSTGTDLSLLSVTLNGPLQNLFKDDFIMPVLDRHCMQYSLPFCDYVLKSLCSIGAAQSVILDHVLVCPDCRALPTVRIGCSMCLSNEIEESRMIHHFACAHVDFVEQFEYENEMVCPKCRGRKLIIGADYEYLDGPKRCLECGHADPESIYIGHCMNCENRFPMNSAARLEIVGYRVNRLDPLALVDTA